MLRDDRLHILKGLPLGEIRQIASAAFVRLLLLQEGAENAVDLPPAFGEDMLSLRREGMAATLERGRDRFVHMGFRRRAQQLAADQEEHVPLTHGQDADIRLFHLHCGDNGVVVGYVLIGDHSLHQREETGAPVKGRHLCRQVDHAGGRFRHVRGQVPAVRPGIGQQLLFIEALGVVKRLLRRVAEHPVCLPL